MPRASRVEQPTEARLPMYLTSNAQLWRAQSRRFPDLDGSSRDGNARRPRHGSSTERMIEAIDMCAGTKGLAGCPKQIRADPATRWLSVRCRPTRSHLAASRCCGSGPCSTLPRSRALQGASIRSSRYDANNGAAAVPETAERRINRDCVAFPSIAPCSVF